MKPRVVVVGLGPGDPVLLTEAASEAIAGATVRYLRTARHPSAAAAAPATSFDAVYERAETLEAVYTEIVDQLVAAAGLHGEVLYAVPGSPLVAERTVQLLMADTRVEVKVVAGLSFLDLAWQRLGVDPVDAGVQVIDGHRFVVEAAGRTGPFLVAQCDSTLVLSEMKLAVNDGPTVAVLQRLGTPDEAVSEVAWDDLDRAVEPDHLTCVWVPSLAEPVAAELVRFAELVRTLRERCPWDRAQTHQSLTRHLLEETYEVLEAIEDLEGDSGYEHLEDELGDLLFQVAFHATLAAEAGQFDLAGVARSIHDKLVRRHPHVFDPDAPPTTWDQIKAGEKGRAPGVMSEVPGNLPALLYAHKVQRKAAAVGFDWESADGAVAKLGEELTELHGAIDAGDAHALNEELGDLLFSVVNVARHLDIDPEATLRAATAKFRARFAAVEALAVARGVELAGAGMDVLDGLWDEVKGTEGSTVF